LIDGVVFKELVTHTDERGFFREIIRVTDGFFGAGFGQWSHSLMYPDNLGYAYEKKGEDAKAVAQYNETIELLPGSLYAKAAQSALNRRKQKGSEN